MSIRSITGKPGRNMADLPSSCRDTDQGSENLSSLGDQGRGTCSPVVSPALPTGVSSEAPVFSSSALCPSCRSDGECSLLACVGFVCDTLTGSVLAGSDSVCSASSSLTGSRLGDGSPALSVASCSVIELSGASAVAPAFSVRLLELRTKIVQRLEAENAAAEFPEYWRMADGLPQVGWEVGPPWNRYRVFHRIEFLSTELLRRRRVDLGMYDDSDIPF